MKQELTYSDLILEAICGKKAFRKRCQLWDFGFVCFFLSAVPKLRIDIMLLFLRAFTIGTWAFLLVQGTCISLGIQLTFVAIIFFTDAVDGIISRRFSTEQQKYIFRILDVLVDKVGMLIFISTLFILDYVHISLLLCIIIYNVILLIPPIIKISHGTAKNLPWIQATFMSRFYAASVGIFCFLSLNIDLANRHRIISLTYFCILGVFALVSQFNKIRKLKG